MPASRRHLLATGALALSGSLGGCILFGSSGNTDSPNEGQGSEDLTADEKATVTAFGEGIKGWVRTVAHNPREKTALVEGAIDVGTEQDYRVRLGIIDKNGVVLQDDVTDETLYNVGTNTVTAEFEDVRDCEACHSGLLHVEQKDGPSNGSASNDGSGTNTPPSEDTETETESETDESEESDGESSEESEGGTLGTLGSDDGGEG